MKNAILIIFLIVLVVLLGTWPLSILSIIFKALGTAFAWVAKALNVFGWNGIL